MGSLEVLGKMAASDFRAKLGNITKAFDYATPLTAVAALASSVAGQTPATITIDATAAFMATEVSGAVIITSSGLPYVPELHAEPEVLIVSEDAGIRMMNRPLRWRNFVGWAGEPFRLATPYVFPRGSSVTVTFYNYETIGLSCQLTLGGFKVYP